MAAADIFSRGDVGSLLHNKKVLMFGDSNMRAIYKDLVWLAEYGTMISKSALRNRNEESHANDKRLSNGTITASRDYKEIRQYDHNMLIRYEFITRLYLPSFIDAIKKLRNLPDVIVINSCLWDLSRWGPNGLQDFKANVNNTMQLLKDTLKGETRVIWTTTLPPSFKSRGGFLTKEIDFIRLTLPFHIVEANKYVSSCAARFGFDVLDLHYHLRFLIDLRCHDGIHWQPDAVRFMTNFLLTHLCLSWHRRLPGKMAIDNGFLKRSDRCYSDVTDDKLFQLNVIASNLHKCESSNQFASEMQQETIVNGKKFCRTVAPNRYCQYKYTLNHKY